MMNIVKRVQNWFAGQFRRAELDRIDDAELSRIARDVGVSVDELGDMAQLGPGAADLLPRRMQAIGLEFEAVGREEPIVVQDMQRLCAQCSRKGRCEHDLRANPADPSWESYCPNSTTLRALQRS
jgi:hypothetical protein